MNDNHNVKNEETEQEITPEATTIVNEILSDSSPSNSIQSSVTTPPKSTFQKTLIASVSQNVCKQQRNINAHSSILSQIKEPKPTLEIYRTLAQFSESQSDVDLEMCVSQSNGIPKIINVQPMPYVPPLPPSYSTVIKQGRPSLDIRRDARSMEVQHLSPFSRIPPPSYAEIHGVWSREISNASSDEQVLLGPDPIYIWCTHCATVVITVTQSQRSKFTHITAAALCLFGCWPCAMLPYCMNSCKNIYHYCPDCNYLFGMYRPW